ncbi:MAG: serine protease [Ignavibacteria bacterium GWA2_55_11]|nr:MAG: serine protease [Ignavibacteria bacterium GWA2_55_11]OGU73134.1 MAG: serine protease [Ignavibacteria bacterium RIFCSPLOWO2_12_FULL_56_21]
MKRSFLVFCCTLFLAGSSAAQRVSALTIDGPITPATAEYVKRGLDDARRTAAQAVLLRLNTPGGLLESTRSIVRDLLDSPVPVIVYVSPSGSRAGSAGVFITIAGHIAAMSPGTNIGAAHPVNLQGGIDSVMNEKATNDAAAFIRSIAGRRNRNVQWAEEAVRKSTALTESEALDRNVIDIVAPDDSTLLRKIDGRSVSVTGGEVKLATAGATIEENEPSFAESLLGIISDPNIAYILFLLGLYGLLFELYNPGSILPGVVGGISIILAFYSMQTLPVNYAGVALIVFAVILFILEIKIASHGLLGIGGTIALLLGSAMLFRPSSELEFVEISWSVILLVAAMTVGFFVFVIGIGLTAQRRRPTTGADALIGASGTARTQLSPTGTIMVRGELWNAHAIGSAIPEGASVRIVRIDNMTLIVESVPEKPL